MIVLKKKVWQAIIEHKPLSMLIKKAFKGTVLGNILICFLAEFAEKIETTLLFSLKFLSHKFRTQEMWIFHPFHSFISRF